MITITIPNRPLNITKRDIEMQAIFKTMLVDFTPDQLCLMHSALTARLAALGWCTETFSN